MDMRINKLYSALALAGVLAIGSSLLGPTVFAADNVPGPVAGTKVTEAYARAQTRSDQWAMETATA
ncbi:hypothetical protein D3879_15480 [Pseudomonas cavernicola]|uniref:Uncharacterized protein n=1 Tax=Pseudomonas cavernicola TaxID=2320866 RepID=A0A418XF81_9PSED|nr:hypothetical protein [Pseudomonas cavernicola]RJG11067.1 hypothetical protein D3879_15480 [Pseudomonas cavernicola]